MHTAKPIFKFQMTPKQANGRRFTAEVHLTQEEFEDHQVRRAAIHACIAGRGLNPGEVVWHESPQVEPGLEARLRELIACEADAQLIHYYPHGRHHLHYKMVDVDGVRYRYMAFQNGHFIKCAPEMAQTEEIAC